MKKPFIMVIIMFRALFDTTLKLMSEFVYFCRNSRGRILASWKWRAEWSAPVLKAQLRTQNYLIFFAFIHRFCSYKKILRTPLTFRNVSKPWKSGLSKSLAQTKSKLLSLAQQISTKFNFMDGASRGRP